MTIAALYVVGNATLILGLFPPHSFLFFSFLSLFLISNLPLRATNTTDVLKDVTNVGIFVKERLLLPTASKSLAAFGRSFSIYSVAEHAVLTHEIGPSFVADHTHRLTTLG